MFSKLKRRWGVNSLNLALVICTFALGGSLCGYLGKRLMPLTGLEKGFAWVGIYIATITILWPLCVLALSIPLGQFAFFKNYLYKIWCRLSGKKKNITHIAIFASGAGSNAQKIIDYFRNSGKIKVALIVCNNPAAGVLQIASRENIPVLMLEKSQFAQTGFVKEIQEYQIDFIVLAGFLWKVPPVLIRAYPEKIINIHPALLPKYGGKGMYGSRVHEAVIAAGEKESGISIHYVDELYDHGKTILQATCPVVEQDTAESLAQKVHTLEHLHYPAVIEKLLRK